MSPCPEVSKGCKQQILETASWCLRGRLESPPHGGYRRAGQSLESSTAVLLPSTIRRPRQVPQAMRKELD
jgi:hypothetical protein